MRSRLFALRAAFARAGQARRTVALAAQNGRGICCAHSYSRFARPSRERAKPGAQSRLPPKAGGEFVALTAVRASRGLRGSGVANHIVSPTWGHRQLFKYNLPTKPEILAGNAFLPP